MNNRIFTAISSTKITKIIHSSQYRIILVAPAIFNNVAEALIRKGQQIGRENISIVLDCDEEVFRLGYGDFDAVKAITESGLEVREAPGLRVGILICDDNAWIFSPVALYVQPEVHSDETPNAIEITGNDINRLVNSIKSIDTRRSDETGHTYFENVEIGQRAVGADDIGYTDEALKIAPPVPFDIARQVRVFESYIQYVE